MANKRMLIDAMHSGETRVVIADDHRIYDFDFVSTSKKQLKGNIYLAKITRVEPSLQAAFVEYGGGKQGFLPFSEIHADYYQIPSADRKRLMEEAAADESVETEDMASHETQPGSETYGEQPVILENAPSPDVPEASTELMEAPSDLPAQSALVEETAHPAYLMQGAIDISASETVDPQDGEDNTPISQVLAESEQQPDQQDPVVTYGTESAEAPAEDAAGEAAASEAPRSEGVETLASEEEEYQDRPKRNQFHKRYKIQEVIRRGQIVLVQVIKEERGNKGCSLTTYLSLAGRYCVLMPNSPKDGGISRKIASVDDRKRLKAIYQELKLAAGMSVIIRTAGLDRTRAEIKRDYDYLVKLWNQIREDTLKSNAPALIYEESDIIKRAIRDQYTSDIEELIVQGEEGYNAAKEFMKLLMASHTPKIKLYEEATPLFYAYDVEEQLMAMHDPVVKLRSGGYIVINPTEALISIDVNSGRATGERNIEETAAKTNLEAAQEVARQLRLRDLAGLIVIDFIDMMESRNRRAVEKALKDALKADRAKIQLGRISPFGLLEMSRQRLRPSISETNMVQCPHCEGRGYIRSNESLSIQMIRAVEKEASAGVWSSLRLIAPQAVALHLLNTKRDALRAIEQRNNLTVQVLIDTDLAASEFNLEKMRRSGSGNESNDNRERDRDRDRERRPRRDRDRDRDRNERNRSERQPEPVAAEEGSGSNIEEVGHEREEGDERGERKGRRRRRGGRGRGRDRDRDNRPPQQNSNAESGENIQSDIAAVPAETMDGAEQPQANDTNEQRPHRGGRGGRGRRRWRDRDERNKDRDQHYNSANRATNDAPVAAAASDGNSLPAFATEDRMAAPPPPPPAVAVAVNEAPRDPNAPAKKGWWKKMIELDD